ncbi:MAG: hypothetical protein ABSB15_29225 [Bryobacteraceae bacterium]|jgi:hypothetical protein
MHISCWSNGPGQLAAVVHLLETIISPEDGDTLSGTERDAVDVSTEIQIRPKL